MAGDISDRSWQLNQLLKSTNLKHLYCFLSVDMVHTQLAHSASTRCSGIARSLIPAEVLARCDPPVDAATMLDDRMIGADTVEGAA